MFDIVLVYVDYGMYNNHEISLCMLNYTGCFIRTLTNFGILFLGLKLRKVEL